MGRSTEIEGDCFRMNTLVHILWTLNFIYTRVIVSIETYVVLILYIPRTVIVMFWYLRNKFYRLDNFWNSCNKDYCMSMQMNIVKKLCEGIFTKFKKWLAKDAMNSSLDITNYYSMLSYLFKYKNIVWVCT